MRSILLMSFTLIFVNASFAGGMEVYRNVDPKSFPQSLRDNAKYQPLDKGYIDVTKPPYNAVGNGIFDDTKAIQQALDDAYYCNLISFFPAEKIFLISSQLKCFSYIESRKFAYQLVGSTKGKIPVIKLKDGSNVEGDILILFQLITKDKPNPPSLYGSLFRGINIDLGNNPSVSGISMAGAQYCAIEDTKIFGIAFNAGICSLPGSGGGTVNVTVSGGKIGILQNQYRPNPTIIGMILENQSECGLKITESRGPVIVTGFKIISPKNPSQQYQAIYLNNIRSTEANGVTDHGNANLCLTDGSIEVYGSTGKAIYNYAQDVVINNVYVNAHSIIESGNANPPSKIVMGAAGQWKLISNYIFTSQLDKSSVWVNGKDLNNRETNFQQFNLLTTQLPHTDFISKHIWHDLPNWDDQNTLDIVKNFGATPENIDEFDDDGKAIQKAIDQATTPGNANFGKIVFIPRGHFHIKKPLVLKSGLRIFGAGKFISIIQAAFEWKNSKGAVLESEDNANGSLLLSDFGILGFPQTTFIRISQANTTMKDIATEVLKLENKNTYEPFNSASVPYINFTNNASGKIYHVCTDHIPSMDKPNTKHLSNKGYHLVAVQNTSAPITFYQLSVEHMRSSPQVLFENAKYVTVYGFKYELPQELINIINSCSISIIGGSGNHQLVNKDDRAIIVIQNSKNILFQNLCRKSLTVAFNHPVLEFTKYWIVNGNDKVTSDYAILSYTDNDTR